MGINAQGCICDSTTLPLISVSSATNDEQSCAYTAMPSSIVSNPISVTTEIYTSNCQACTLVGGVANAATCGNIPDCTPTLAVISTTDVPSTTFPASAASSTDASASSSPTIDTALAASATSQPNVPFVVNLSNSTIPIGDADNANKGADLRKNVFNKLKDLCPDDAKACSSSKSAEIDKIPTVIDGKEAHEKLSFNIKFSQYESTAARDKMLAYSVSTWERSIGKNCKEVEYKVPLQGAKDKCKQGPVRKRGDGPPTLMEPDCTYKGTVCQASSFVSTTLTDSKGNPYGNQMDIVIEWALDESPAAEFVLCEVILDGLTALVGAVAPELIPAEVGADVEWEAVCDEIRKFSGSS